MAKILIDTSAWFDISKPRFEEVLSELEDQVNKGITVILTCDIIINEWCRNKDRIIKEVIASIKSHAKSAIMMSELLSAEEKSLLQSIVDKYISIQKEQEKLAILYFERVEKLIKISEFFQIKDEVKIEMANRSLLKIAPFHNNKNNMADALLLFGAFEHVKEKNELATDLIFVTSNHKEFGNPEDISKIHPDLEQLNVHFSNNLAQALKMRKETIDLMDEYHENAFWMWIESEAEIARGK